MKFFKYLGAAAAGVMMFASAGNALTVNPSSTLLDITGGFLNVLPAIGGLTTNIEADLADLLVPASAAWKIARPAAGSVLEITTVNPNNVALPGAKDFEVGFSTGTSFVGLIAGTLHTFTDGAGVNSGIPDNFVFTIPVLLDPFFLVARWTGFNAVSNAFTLSVTAIPVPAALPLFGTGLGILGFLGWRRRRNQNAQAAV